jgi:hypothetical protein
MIVYHGTSSSNLPGLITHGPHKRTRSNDPGCRGKLGFSTSEDLEKAVLVIAHDGGDARDFFNYDYCDYESIEVMREALERIGYYSEQATCWYSLVFPLEKTIGQEKEQATDRDQRGNLPAPD